MRSATVKRGDWADVESEAEVGGKNEHVEAVGNPYALVKRSGRWFVVKRDSGTVVSGGDHGRDKKKALAHFRALEMATSGEDA